MSSEISRRESQDATPTSAPEVEFALVLSRMIDSVKNDPEHLRQTIYELARHKLQEQFTHDNAKDVRPLSNALEVAIQGVEAFARKDDQALEALGNGTLGRKLALAQERPPTFVEASRQEAPWSGSPVLDHGQAFEPTGISQITPVKRKTPAFGAPWRFALLAAVILAAGVAVRYRGVSFDSLRAQVDQLLAPAPTQPEVRPIAPEQQAAVIPPAPKPSPLVPTSYGIYAVSADKLYELELLPGRAPDIRVAVSAAITTPSRTVLPDGHLRFVIYRRDSVSSAADRAEVRVIAKVVRAISFNDGGKAVVSKADDSWVIRNISLPYRTAPNKDNPDMYEVQSEDPDQALPPGRYALILKGQSYDFSVDGDVTDPKQCLERLAATNGQFYSECRKP